MYQLRKHLLPLAAALILFVALTMPLVAGDRGVFKIDERFEVNGRIFPASTLVVRAVTDYTPVATLNEIQVGAENLGMLLAYEVTGEPASDDLLVFRRAADGHLVLEAVAMRGEPMREFYSFRTLSHGGRWFAPGDGEGRDGEALVGGLR